MASVRPFSSPNFEHDPPFRHTDPLFSLVGCVAYVASGVDLVVALGALSYTLFFIFIILEFRRNVEVCLWGTALHASNTP